MDYILMYEEIVMLIFLTCIYLYSQYAKKPQYVKWLIDCFKMKGHYKKKRDNVWFGKIKPTLVRHPPKKNIDK